MGILLFALLRLSIIASAIFRNKLIDVLALKTDEASFFHAERNTMTTILMLATYGLEIVEVGGTLALHSQAGDDVYGAVLLCRTQWHDQVRAAATILGVKEVEFLDFATGEVQVDVPSKMTLVRLLRRVRPDVLITQDPEHSYHDLDPDRRLAMLLYLEAVALAGRDWRIEDCGGYAPHTVRDLYYMTPEHSNCVVEIGQTFGTKQRALAELPYQLEYTAQVYRERLGNDLLAHLVSDPALLKGDDLTLGRELHREMDKALALSHGLLSHSGTVMSEAFRHEGVFRLKTLRELL